MSRRKTRKKSNIKRIILIIVCILIIVFIFSQSLMAGNTSSKQSLGFVSGINSFLSMLGIKFQFTNIMARKTAHFLEFFILGVFLTFAANTYTNKPIKKLPTIFFVSLATAVADESIQLFIPGRAGMVQDILLDFSGAAVGTFLIIFLLFLSRKISGK